MRNGSRRGWVRTAIALLVVSATVVACSDDGPESAETTTTSAPAVSEPTVGRVGPFAVMTGAATPRGELIPGLPIAAGSVLIGPTFPDLEQGGGFVALLLVTGDPVAVYNDYVDAAAGLGMRSGGGGGCIAGFASITCLRRVIDPADGEALSMLVERRPLAGGFVSHAALRYEPPGSVDPEEAGVVVPSPPTSPLPVLDLPEQVAAPPDDRWSQVIVPGSPALALAEGTMLAGPPGPCPCGTGGWSAVLRIDGPPEAAIDAYARQLGVEQPEVRSGDGSAEVRVADLGLVPGGITQLRTVTDARGTWLLVAVSLG